MRLWGEILPTATNRMLKNICKNWTKPLTDHYITPGYSLYPYTRKDHHSDQSSAAWCRNACYRSALVQQNQPHNVCVTGPLSDSHLLPVQWKLLQTEAPLCHGLTGVPKWPTSTWKELRAELQATGSGMWTTPGSKSEQGKWKISQNKKNDVGKKIKFTQGDFRGDFLPFLDCAVHISDRIDVYWTPSWISQVFLPHRECQCCHTFLSLHRF